LCRRTLFGGEGGIRMSAGAGSLWKGTANKWMKYQAVGRITVRQQVHYRVDFLFRALLLLLILFVFIHLWQAVYGGDSGKLVAGFSLKRIAWYPVFAEAVTMACTQLCIKIEDEVKQGDIAVRFIRPLSYIGFHFMAYMGDAALRFIVQLAAGTAIAWFYVGAPAFGLGWAGFFVLLPGAFVTAFFLNLSIALCA